MSTRKGGTFAGTTVSGRHEVLLRRRSQQNIKNKFCQLDSQQELYFRDVTRMTLKIKEEEAASRTNLSNLSTYYENTDFNKLTTNITDEERSRQHYKALLERHPTTTGSDCIHRRSCPAYPCQRLRSYHFMFRNVSNTNQIQKINLVPLPDGKTDDIADNTSICHKNPKGHEDVTKGKGAFSREKNKKVLPSNSVNMTRKEIFLRCAVLRRRLQDSDRKFIVHAVNYGKPLPWRAVKKPAMLEQTYGTEFGGHTRLLAF